MITLYKNFVSKYKESAWLLGIVEDGYEGLKGGRIHWVNNGVFEGKKWFADPFILEYNSNEIQLLVEEFDYKVHKGRIAKIIVDRGTWTVSDCSILLDLETHLSFPMIWRQNGEIFVFPENYKSGGWNMYRYDKMRGRLVLQKQIINEKLTDAIIYKGEKQYWLLSTYVPKPNGPVLTVWRSANLEGPFEESQKITFPENIGRNAGMLFQYAGKLIRPAQESNFSYGHAIVFQEANIAGDDLLSFNELFRFYSPHPHFKHGSHTFNQHPNGMAVIDVKGLRYPIVGTILKGVQSLLVLLGLKKRYIPQ